jgi:hypothetical protein
VFSEFIFNQNSKFHFILKSKLKKEPLHVK